MIFGVVQIMALMIGSIAGYVPHMLFGDEMSFFSDFMASTVVGGVAYVGAIYYLKKARGDF